MGWSKNCLAAVVLAVSAMLTIAPALSQTHISPLTPDLLQKVLQLVASKGTDREMPEKFSDPLGLTTAGAGQKYLVRQILINEHLEGVVQDSINISRGSDQDVTFTYRGYKKDKTPFLDAYRSDRNGNLISAIEWNIQTDQITASPAAAAQVDLDGLLRFWAENVDKLLGPGK